MRARIEFPLTSEGWRGRVNDGKRSLNPALHWLTHGGVDALAEPVWALKIDKDCHVDTKWVEDYARLVVGTCRRHGIKVMAIRMCRSRRKGLHFYIDINPPISAELANRMQWLLGDDCQRVNFNRARIGSGLTEWNKLFEKPSVRLSVIYRSKAKCNDVVERPQYGETQTNSRVRR